MPDQTILAVDVGGLHVKLLISSGSWERRRFASGPDLGPREMVEQIASLTNDWLFDAVSIGVPASAHAGRIVSEPVNLGRGWVGFDFEESFARPTKVVNDAAMQASGVTRAARVIPRTRHRSRVGTRRRGHY